MLYTILFIAFFALLFRLANYPAPWFDEGFSTDAALSLIEQGVYGTRSADGALPFDSEMTSGPSVVLPVALSFFALGVDYFQARLSQIPYALLALLALYRLSASLYGRRAALFILLIWLAMPPLANISFLQLSRQVLGEGPALTFLLAGLWLWLKSWRQQRSIPAWLAGLFFGLAIVSKMYLGITILPALGAVALLRSLCFPRQWLTAWAPLVAATGLTIAWLILSFIGTPAELRHTDETNLGGNIRALLLPGLVGRNLSNSVLIKIVIVLTGCLAAGWRLTHSDVTRNDQSVTWAELTLLLMVIFSTAWFAFLSIGWPRYFYVGWMMGLILFARWLWGGIVFVAKHWPRMKPLLMTGALLSLTLSLGIFHFEPAWHQSDSDARAMAAFVRYHIPREAIIFTWEWELRAPSRHWNYRAPPADLLTQAIQQRFIEQQPFDVDYDLLAADPDFVVRGEMSDWVGLYDEATLHEHFVEALAIGKYRLYQRR